ncbi:hypothetical protein BV20DRAFT_4700 [Pilatotrama ljubarskyi]|nr:hypothetical protein BV20DRAFT_4700 [Pilatotrama ljubarskyi]
MAVSTAKLSIAAEHFHPAGPAASCCTTDAELASELPLASAREVKEEKTTMQRATTAAAGRLPNTLRAGKVGVHLLVHAMTRSGTTRIARPHDPLLVRQQDHFVGSVRHKAPEKAPSQGIPASRRPRQTTPGGVRRCNFLLCRLFPTRGGSAHSGPSG